MSSSMGRFSKIIWIVIAILVVIIGGKYAIDAIYPYEHADYIEEAAEKYGVDPALVFSVINSQTHFKETAELENAKGLMGIPDKTVADLQQRLGISSSSLGEVKSNIYSGTAILGYLLDNHNDDEFTAVVAYIASPSSAEEWLKDSVYSADGKTLTETPENSLSKEAKSLLLQKKVYTILRDIHNIKMPWEGDSSNANEA